MKTHYQNRDERNSFAYAVLGALLLGLIVATCTGSRQAFLARTATPDDSARTATPDDSATTATPDDSPPAIETRQGR